MENLKKSNELLEAIIDGTAFDKETGLIWEHWVNAIIKQVDLNNIELRASEKPLDENSGLHKHFVKASFSNKYGFLYWCENDTTADDGRCKWIEASTLDEACAKFIKKKAPKTLRQVDYEVQLGNKYIDISERADFKNWL